MATGKKCIGLGCEKVTTAKGGLCRTCKRDGVEPETEAVRTAEGRIEGVGSEVERVASRDSPDGRFQSSTLVVHVKKTTCPACGSPDRTPMKIVSQFPYIKGIIDGREYLGIINRRCECRGCGQVRIEKEYQLVPTKKAV